MCHLHFAKRSQRLLGDLLSHLAACEAVASGSALQSGFSHSQRGT